MTDEPVFCMNVQHRRKPYAPGTGSYAFFTVCGEEIKEKTNPYIYMSFIYLAVTLSKIALVFFFNSEKRFRSFNAI